MNTKLQYSVVVADDCDDDLFLLRRAISRQQRFKLLHELPDGREVVAYLAGSGEYADRKRYPIPDLLMLDIKMPGATGFDVLSWLREQSFQNLTVVMLSGSDLDQDIRKAFSLGAHGFWSKTAKSSQQDLIAAEIEALLDGRHTPKRIP